MSTAKKTEPNTLHEDASAENTATKGTPTSGVFNIQQLFKVMVDQGASDLHLTVGAPPVLRINGEMIRVKTNPLRSDDTMALIAQVLTVDQKKEFEKNLELDFSFGIKGLARFRANVFHSKGGVSGVFRLIPSLIPDFKSLNLPNILIEMSDAKNGLILVTGPTGSGKSTTLASLIDRLNSRDKHHIITLEDPIEFVHEHKASIVNQREVGVDTGGWKKGLKSMLRQDPDIVLIGELRDIETIEAALTIAETGHLVFGTLHTNSSVQTINRLINVFPSEQQDRVRTLLSFVLQGVVAQQLVPRSFGGGRALAMEILVPTAGIRNLIREDKLHQIYSQMQIGQDKTGMITMNQSLARLVESGQLDTERALEFTSMPDELNQMLGIKGKN